MALYGADKWKLRKVDQKYLKSFKIWSRRRLDKITWTDRVRNEETLLKYVRKGKSGRQ
jgi:hypothetical protein